MTAAALPAPAAPVALALPLLAQVERRSAPTTDLGERLAWTGLVVAVVVVLALLMRRGWQRRVASQADVPVPPAPPAGLPGVDADLVAPAAGTYVSTTSAGDWLDRIAVHGLGVASAAVLRVTPRGVLLERTGAPDVWVAAADLERVGLAPGMAGKFVGRDGLLVLTWRLGDRLVDTGFRATEHSRTPTLHDAAATLLGRTPS